MSEKIIFTYYVVSPKYFLGTSSTLSMVMAGGRYGRSRVVMR